MKDKYISIKRYYVQNTETKHTFDFFFDEEVNANNFIDKLNKEK